MPGRREPAWGWAADRGGGSRQPAEGRGAEEGLEERGGRKRRGPEARGRGAEASGRRTVGEAAGLGGLPAGARWRPAGLSRETRLDREGRARADRRGGAEGCEAGRLEQRSGRGDPPPTGDRSRQLSALGCRRDPGIQDTDGASPKMGRRPQLPLVKVRADRPARDQRLSGPGERRTSVGRGAGGGELGTRRFPGGWGAA